jgi:hypothetical protein
LPGVIGNFEEMAVSAKTALRLALDGSAGRQFQAPHPGMAW